MAKYTPTNKVAAGGIAGALSLILVWVAGLAGLEIPAEVAVALTAVIAFATTYFTKDKGTGKHVAGDDDSPVADSRDGLGME